MVLLGSFLANTGLVNDASVEKSLEQVLSERPPSPNSPEHESFRAGAGIPIAESL